MSAPALRPIDWRFLLADPRPPRIAHDAAVEPAVVAALRAIGEDVTALDAADGDRDLVVTADADAATLRAAHAALRPGGVLYAAWRPRRSLRAPHAVAAAGFREARAYWRRPGGEDRVWLSADGSAGITAALGEHAALRRGARLAWPLQGAAGAALPRSIVAVRAGGDAAHSPGLPDLGPLAPAAGIVLRAPGGSERNKVILVVAGPGGAPSGVVKLARIDAARPGLAREARSLAALGPVADAVGAPRLLFHREADDAVGESVVTGEPLLSVIERDGLAAVTVAVTDWLVTLAQRTTDPACDPAPLIDALLAEFTAAFAGTVDAAELDEAGRLLAALPPLPCVFEHRDCSPWNLLRRPAGDIAGLDWESAEPRGIPLTDLVYFLAYGGFTEDRPADADLVASSARRLDAPPGRDAERRYCEAVGVPQDAIPTLRVVTWMIHACTAAAEAPGEPERPNAWSTTATLLGLWRAALAAARTPGA